MPGTLEEKIDPYMRPLYDALFDMMDRERTDELMERGVIEIAPLAYMRGRTLSDAFVVLDEAQNTTPEQMKMFLTRMGVGSKVVVTGDVTQIDLPDKVRSGLIDALHVLRDVEGIAQVRLTERDVVRHRLVQQIVKAYEKAAEEKAPAATTINKQWRSINVSNKVLITNDQNVVKVPSGLRILIRRSCNAVLDFEHFDGPAEISVTFVDNNRIHELNKEYRDKDSATDVLSFPLGENGEYDIDEDNGCKLLGDIVISMERAMEQAELYGHSLQREVAYLTVHSMLHLLGYDHEAGGLEAVRMREKEEAVLIQLGLPRTVSYTSDEI